jgi:hypothetical protein
MFSHGPPSPQSLELFAAHFADSKGWAVQFIRGQIAGTNPVSDDRVFFVSNACSNPVTKDVLIMSSWAVASSGVVQLGKLRYCILLETKARLRSQILAEYRSLMVRNYPRLR